MNIWFPIYTKHLSQNAIELIKLCKQEPNPMISRDIINIYKNKITVIEFIDKWIQLFSYDTQKKMSQMRLNIDIAARKNAIMFVSKLKVASQNNSLDISKRDNHIVQPVLHNAKKTFRNSVDSDYRRDAYRENPLQCFKNSLRY